MMKPFFRLSLLFLLLITAWNCDVFQAKSYQPVTRFDPERDPSDDLQTAVVEAQKTNRRILLDVGGNWCPWCHKLDAFIENNSAIHTFVEQHFIVLKINYSPENKNEAFLKNYPDIPGYPHFFVLDSDGGLLHSQNTAELERGDGYNADKMLDFFKKWAAD